MQANCRLEVVVSAIYAQIQIDSFAANYRLLYFTEAFLAGGGTQKLCLYLLAVSVRLF